MTTPVEDGKSGEVPGPDPSPDASASGNGNADADADADVGPDPSEPPSETVTPTAVTTTSTSTTSRRAAKAAAKAKSAKRAAHKVKAAVAKILEKSKREGDLYDVPVQQLEWGQPQEMPHGIWAQLFLDLTYVGVAFKLGELLKYGLLDEDGAEFNVTFGLFAALFLALEGMWFRRLAFDSRFCAEDLTHRAWQLAQGLLVSLMAYSITDLHTMQKKGSKSTILFSGALFAHALLETIVYGELWAFGATPGARGSGRSSVITSGYTIVASAIALGLAVGGQNLAGPATLWAFTSVAQRFHILGMIALKIKFDLNKMAPMNVVFSAHRKGELIAIFLGESIISIIIVPLQTSATFLTTWILSYVLVGALASLFYSSYPSDPNEHAMRRSSTRALILGLVESVLGMGLICVGAAFKVLLASVDDVAYTDARQVQIVWFLSGSLCVTLVMCLLARVLHHGFEEEFCVSGGASAKAIKGVTWVVKLGLSFIPLAAPAFEIPQWAFMLYFTGLTVILFFVHLADFRRFREHHAERIAAEVEKRMKRFAASQPQSAGGRPAGHGHKHHHHHGGGGAASASASGPGANQDTDAENPPTKPVADADRVDPTALADPSLADDGASILAKSSATGSVLTGVSDDDYVADVVDERSGMPLAMPTDGRIEA